MKVKFSLLTNYVPEWNDNRELPEDEQCKAVLSALESMDLLELADALERQAEDGEVDTATMSAADIRSLLKETGRLLPKYVQIAGIEGDDGPITVEQIVTYPDFMVLAVELLMELASISQPNEEDIKN